MFERSAWVLVHLPYTKTHKRVHLDAVWDTCAVHRADLEYQVIHGFSKVAFAKLQTS